MTIHDIKRLTAETSPKYFCRENMKAAGQRLKDFKVYKQLDGRYIITAPITDRSGKHQGHSARYFNPLNNKLERE